MDVYCTQGININITNVNTVKQEIFACRKRVIMLLNRNLPTRCQKTSLRAFISWIAGMALSMR